MPGGRRRGTWGSLVSFFNLGAWGVLYGYTPELYPTGVVPARAGPRVSGVSGGIVGPYLLGMMLGAQGLSASSVFVVFAAVLLIIALDVLFLGEETKGRTLEEISESPGLPNVGATPAGSRG